MKTNRKCSQCGAPLDPAKREGARFCDAKCRNDFNNEMKRQDIALGITPPRAKHQPTVECLVCGTAFKRSRSTNDYCSKKCRIKVNNDRYRDKKANVTVDNSINDLL